MYLNARGMGGGPHVPDSIHEQEDAESKKLFRIKKMDFFSLPHDVKNALTNFLEYDRQEQDKERLSKIKETENLQSTVWTEYELNEKNKKIKAGDFPIEVEFDEHERPIKITFLQFSTTTPDYSKYENGMVVDKATGLPFGPAQYRRTFELSYNEKGQLSEVTQINDVYADSNGDDVFRLRGTNIQKIGLIYGKSKTLEGFRRLDYAEFDAANPKEINSIDPEIIREQEAAELLKVRKELGAVKEKEPTRKP